MNKVYLIDLGYEGCKRKAFSTVEKAIEYLGDWWGAIDIIEVELDNTEDEGYKTISKNSGDEEETWEDVKISDLLQAIGNNEQ